MIALLILAIAISFFILGIFKVFVNEKFYMATQMTFWAFCGQAFFGMYLVVWNFINYTEQTHKLLCIDIFMTVFHLIFCYLLVAEKGIIGAAIAFMLTNFIRLLFTWGVSNNTYPMP
jgi:O-antigen/teichoic acid export membrane protein